MPRTRSSTEIAAGQLVSTIQKVWTYRAGTEQVAAAESVMNRAHDLLKAVKGGQLEALLAGQSVQEYLGSDWVKSHPGVARAVSDLDAEIK